VADTADTLCYATKENQDATLALLDGVQTAAAPGRALALVVGGHNSSNTSHLVELCEDAGLPTFFVDGPDALVSPDEIHHWDWRAKQPRVTTGWLPSAGDGADGAPVDLLLTAGASCPDALLDAVLRKVAGWVPGARDVEAAVDALAA
jgi:4-hydroxy-3-methylbut-2-enyl diphosphate reductase